MPGHRMGRVTEDIKRELSAILRTVKDQAATGMLSIVRCPVTYRSQKYLSVLWTALMPLSRLSKD